MLFLKFLSLLVLVPSNVPTGVLTGVAFPVQLTNKGTVLSNVTKTEVSLM